MRYLIVSLVALFLLQPIAAQETGNPRSLALSALSSATPPADSIAKTLWRIAVSALVPIVFQSMDQAIIGGALGDGDLHTQAHLAHQWTVLHAHQPQPRPRPRQGHVE